jgi:hypothetical protein
LGVYFFSSCALVRQLGGTFALTLDPRARQFIGDSLGNLSGVGSDIMLPKTENAPSGLSEMLVNLRIVATVGGDFGDPILGIRAIREQRLQLSPVTAVPKITIAKDCQSRAEKNDIGSTRKER